MVVFPNFIDRGRTQTIIAAAAKSLHQSQLALRKGDQGRDVSDVRTSQGTFMDSRFDKTGVLKWLDARISAVTNIPTAHFEVCSGWALMASL
jgi:hypothetical protein